jgi:hypothetical protein
MGIEESDRKSPPHWRYFLALEEDLLRMTRYVELTESNFPTYSIQLASSLLATCSEVDVVSKLLCREINRKSKARNIGHYGSQIASAFPGLPKFEVAVPRYGLTLLPWKNWQGKTRPAPYWWKDHNRVKHNRDAHFDAANLGNVLNAIAGLYVLVLLLYRRPAELGELGPNPQLFRPSERNHNGWTQVDTEMLINYALGS